MQLLDAIEGGQVSLDRDRLDAVPGQGAGNRADPLVLGGHDQVEAGLGEPGRQLAADAAGGPGHDGQRPASCRFHRMSAFRHRDNERRLFPPDSGQTSVAVIMLQLATRAWRADVRRGLLLARGSLAPLGAGFLLLRSGATLLWAGA